VLLSDNEELTGLGLSSSRTRPCVEKIGNARSQSDVLTFGRTCQNIVARNDRMASRIRLSRIARPKVRARRLNGRDFRHVVSNSLVTEFAATNSAPRKRFLRGLVAALRSFLGRPPFPRRDFDQEPDIGKRLVRFDPAVASENFFDDELRKGFVAAPKTQISSG
jgi:hypothetical protein